eukprot:CAMPEP_0180277704 /NCGR_PEP_ID=MMETSP0988-20121125/7072_1 /TAXON_ID=697907 /ORGANISM="non described non described, Strain CCMP2293" /LENGTH=177 /DNA_ID=CAMNT_0022249163 /DNA_START=341 /DNA_END=874 /DNA_ORIENTATION=+
MEVRRDLGAITRTCTIGAKVTTLVPASGMEDRRRTMERVRAGDALIGDALIEDWCEGNGKLYEDWNSLVGDALFEDLGTGSGARATSGRGCDCSGESCGRLEALVTNLNRSYPCTVDAADNTSGERTPLLVAGAGALEVLWKLVAVEFAESLAVLKRLRSVPKLESSPRNASLITAL